MEPISLDYIASACDATLLSGVADMTIRRVGTDSRDAQAGDLFVPLKGERFDGHDFLVEVARKGVRAVMTEHATLPDGLPTEVAALRVADTRRALGALAGRYRLDFHLPVIAVAGSNGKTTTKDLIAAVLGKSGSVLASEASFNNDIGVPRTLLRLEAQHRAAVIEAGTNHPGELAPLLAIIQPRIGVLTSVGREHLEFFGDLAGVVAEEGALAEALPEDGLFVLNGDTNFARELAGRSRARVIRFGFRETNDWRITHTVLDEHGTSFALAGAPDSVAGNYRLNLLGSHQAANAVAAIAVGHELGLSREAIQAGLTACQPARMRLQLWDAGGLRVLDDAYNANADSMLAALKTLMELPWSGRRIAVLGDMAELGTHSAAAHAEAGRAAAELGVGQLIAVGSMAAVVGGAARAAGLLRVFEFENVEAAAQAIRRFFKPGDLVLLKASRATRLERVAEVLRSTDMRRQECFTA